VFLVNHQCQIYKSRPTICRTHGLPLLYTNNEGEWELSACELNFAEFEDEFSESNTFPQDKYNSKLFLINKEFIKNFKEKKYNEMDLIPIKNLASFLK
jgi:Fe-S-cluster containining protein